MMGGMGGSGRLAVTVLRSGTANEFLSFLNDFQNAYAALYGFFWTEFAFTERQIFLDDLYRRLQPRDFGYRNTLISLLYHDLLSDSVGIERQASVVHIAPEYVLEVSRVSIQSPGFWEFLGALNPLQQLREYLNDRHKRRQDMEYRELSEKEKLRLESELLEQQIRRSHLDILKDEIELMRGLRVDEEALRQIAWQRLGVSLTALGQHQDRRLIAGPVPEDDGHTASGEEYI